MLTARMPRYFATFATSVVTCWASSRVGVRTMAWTSLREPSTVSAIGIANAAVLPVPVWACPTRCLPLSMTGTTFV